MLLAHDGLHSREFGAEVNKEIGRVVRRNIGAKRRVQLRVISKCVVRSSQPECRPSFHIVRARAAQTRMPGRVSVTRSVGEQRCARAGLVFGSPSGD